MAPPDPPPRTARLILVTPDGEPAGALAAVPVATPWWQDIGPVVDAVRARFGVEATVLRLLKAQFPAPPGGEVTYLAEVERAEGSGWPADISPDVLADHPRRLSYARPGGPAADLAWARAALIERGLRPAGAPFQVRTWNLSSLWRLPCHDRTVWLKVVPPFFAHEGAVIEHLAGERVPRLIARDGARMLTDEIAGEDLYVAEPAQLVAMVDLLVELQDSRMDRPDDLVALGLPDWRAAPLGAAIAGLVRRRAGQLAAQDRDSLAGLIDALPARLATLAECGIADSLVHGDFHSGNVRGQGDDITLLDWGDCGVGHPLLDQTAFLDRIPADQAPAVRAHWERRWREARPGCDPARAAWLLAPLAAARQALIYQGFLDGIEPAEHPYHRDDPVTWLTRAGALA